MTDSDVQRLLVVQSDPEVRHLLTVVLAAEAREVVAVSRGDEAMAVLGKDGVDLVLLDLILPDVDGRTLLANLRANAATAAIPVVVVSGRGGPEIRQDCYDLGADYFTEKPFDPDVLVADVAARLHRRPGPTESQDPVTGLLNRSGLLDVCAQAKTPYTLVLAQLDGFLSLSERWGWEDAESLLRSVAGALQEVSSVGASIARMGGGEFSLFSATQTLGEAADMAQAGLEAIRSLSVRDPDGETVRLTASIGVVDVSAGTPVDEAFEAARRRLFHAREAGGNQVSAQDPDADEKTSRVLVAEDDEISATILVHRLKKEGLDIVHYDNGKDAYEGALAETPHLVILDVKMPGMDGFEVLERLRRTPAFATVPIIMLTSMGSEADVVRGFQLGADDYILKPFSPVELSARVWRLLRRGRSASSV